jgi:hypothetical protein
MPKSKYSHLTPEEVAVLNSVNAGVGFDAVDVVKNKANVSSQNPDTGIANFDTRNTASYEQKNVPTGFHKKGMETK